MLAQSAEGQGELNGAEGKAEPLDADFHVYLNVDGQALVTKIPGGSSVIGKPFSLNMEKV